MSQMAVVQNEQQFDKKKALKIVIVCVSICLIINSFQISTLIMIGVIMACLFGFVKIKFAQFREKGPDNFSPKIRALLYEKSIFDIYADILYFPTISKIIGAFLKPAITKPHPEQLQHTFDEILPQARQAIMTKGVVNIFPNTLRKICYKVDEPLPPIKKQFTWIHADEYKRHDQVHQDTIAKRVVQKIDKRITWPILSVMIAISFLGIKQINSKKAKKILLVNGCMIGAMFVGAIGVIKILKYLKQKQQISKHHHLSIAAKIH